MQKTIVPPYFFIIVAEFIKTDENGQPVRDEDDKPVYEMNYFCRRLVNKQGVVAYEWDTDIKYVYRFPSETIARNFMRVELLDLDGAKVVEYKPGKDALGSLPFDNIKTDNL